jgi:hypothetical protein
MPNEVGTQVAGVQAPAEQVSPVPHIDVSVHMLLDGGWHVPSEDRHV